MAFQALPERCPYEPGTGYIFQEKEYSRRGKLSRRGGKRICVLWVQRDDRPVTYLLKFLQILFRPQRQYESDPSVLIFYGQGDRKEGGQLPGNGQSYAVA